MAECRSSSRSSKVYHTFRADLDTLKIQQYILNTLTNPSNWISKPSSSEDIHDSAKQAQYAIYEGAYLRVFLKWEAFVQDFLEEVFQEVCSHLISNLPTLNPDGKALDKGTQLLDKAFEQWQREAALSPSVQLVLDQEKRKTLLKEYAIKACTGCTPVLHGKRGIGKYLARLFMVDGSPAEKLVKEKSPQRSQRIKPDKSDLDVFSDCPKSKPSGESKPVSDDVAQKILQSKMWPGPKQDKSKIIPILMDCIIDKRIGGDEYQLKIDNREALIAITRLIYGVRCVLVHSKHNQTFEASGGALYNFPDKIAFFDLLGGSNENAKKQFYSLYERVLTMHTNKSRTVGDEILHCDVVNIQRLILLLASRFHNTVVELIEEHYGLHIWDEVESSYD